MSRLLTKLDPRNRSQRVIVAGGQPIRTALTADRLCLIFEVPA